MVEKIARRGSVISGGGGQDCGRKDRKDAGLCMHVKGSPFPFMNLAGRLVWRWLMPHHLLSDHVEDPRTLLRERGRGEAGFPWDRRASIGL
jgi:hypothetical protein